MSELNKLLANLTIASTSSSDPISSLARLLSSPSTRSLIVLVGAGISTSAGIPDFRSPTTGLYANLAKFSLPSPESIFDISFFRNKPIPFYTLAKELFPGLYAPTATHFFLRLLEEKGKLKRVYTQNIDTLERIAGMCEDVIVEAHGSFHDAHCIECDYVTTTETIRSIIFSQDHQEPFKKSDENNEDQKENKGKKNVPRCPDCNGLVKPNIVFFGEQLPLRFFQLSESDFDECDGVLVMGTSLMVHPFASLVTYAGKKVPRWLVNRELVGEEMFDFDERDGLVLGDCDEVCWRLAKLCGWEDELRTLLDGHEKAKSKSVTITVTDKENNVFAHDKLEDEQLKKKEGKDEKEGSDKAYSDDDVSCNKEPTYSVSDATKTESTVTHDVSK